MEEEEEEEVNERNDREEKYNSSSSSSLIINNQQQFSPINLSKTNCVNKQKDTSTFVKRCVMSDHRDDNDDDGKTWRPW